MSIYVESGVWFATNSDGEKRDVLGVNWGPPVFYGTQRPRLSSLRRRKVRVTSGEKEKERMGKQCRVPGSDIQTPGQHVLGRTFAVLRGRTGEEKVQD